MLKNFLEALPSPRICKYRDFILSPLVGIPSRMLRSLNAEPILRLEAVRLTLKSLAGPVNILNGIELVIRQGEAIGLVGPSGSGKSTMLMVMTGLERPTSGKVTVKSQEISAMSEDDSARFRRGNVGIVFQSFHLIPTMTALENVAVPLELALVPDAFERAKQELIDVGLEHRLDHYPSQLSGGEQQRVALARAIAPRPSLLFADEPTGNLDGRTGAEIVEMLFKLQRERGSTLVLVTHDEALAKRCDRIVRLRDGKIEAIEDKAPATPEPVVNFKPVVPPPEPETSAPVVAPAPVAAPTPSEAPASISPAATVEELVAAAPAPMSVPDDVHSPKVEVAFKLAEGDTVLADVPDLLPVVEAPTSAPEQAAAPAPEAAPEPATEPTTPATPAAASASAE
jgi:putative ABC transport system ATP-binding protein